jgi:hypothetical protein
MELIRYVRESRGRNKGQIRGVVVAQGGNGEFRIGWSFTRFTPSTVENRLTLPPDKFDRKKGLMIARGRCVVPSTAKTPRAIQPYIVYMNERAKRAFQYRPVVVAEK